MLWVKKMARLVFNSCAVQLQDDLHATIDNKMKDLHVDLRRDHLINSILNNTQRGITETRYTDHDIIVSVTTHGKRIHEVSLAIESIMQQTMKPNRIVLWLDDSYRGQSLPMSLSLQQKRGLEISYCDNLKSYIKLLPQMRQTPDDAIITIDDDVFYEYDVLEHLIQAYLSAPERIHCCRAHRIRLEKDGSLMPYDQWDVRICDSGTSHLLFLTGVGGVLYPPKCLDPEVFNQKVFMDICPDADDIWFTAMAIKQGTLINKVFTRDERGEDYLVNSYIKGENLSFKNIFQKGNDRQLKEVFSRYSLYDKLFH